MSANMFADSYGLAPPPPPPPQSLVEDVQITFDTDMMDEDEAHALQQQQLQSNNDNAGLLANGVSVGFDTTSGTGDMDMGMDTDTVQIAYEKVHLRGVDTMATGDIEAWERKWVGEKAQGEALVKVQWIDDSSCNLVYPSSTLACSALELLTDPTPPSAGGLPQPTPAQQADLLLIRSARLCDAHPNAKLEVRISRLDDIKQKGARERSRFYLFNPEYDRGEDYERKRRGRREQRRDVAPGEDGDYQRRRYDRQEHERRLDSSSANMYDDNMYDDSGSHQSHRRPRRNRSRSRSRSRSGSRSRYHSRQRSAPGTRRRWRSRTPTRSRSPNRRDHISKPLELFPETAKSEPKGLMGHHGDKDRFYNPPMETVSRIESVEDVGLLSLGGKGGSGGLAVELFPEKQGKSILGLAKQQASSVLSGRELFPEKMGNNPSSSSLSPSSLLAPPPISSPQTKNPTDLASRITLPSSNGLNTSILSSSSTPSGILGYNNHSSFSPSSSFTNEDSHTTTASRKSKSTTGNNQNDLFAEKMASGRKVGLGGSGGGGGDLFDRIEIPGELSGGGSGFGGGSGSGGRRRGRRNKAADLFG